MIQSLWDTEKAVLRREIFNNTILSNKKKIKINNLSLQLRQLEKEYTKSKLVE